MDDELSIDNLGACIAVPPIRPLTWLAVVIHSEELAGDTAWTVTTNDGSSVLPSRRWFEHHPAALTFGASQSDRLGLPLLDLSEPT